MFGRKSWIEAPPEQYASGPTQTGKTTETPGLTPEQVSWLCGHYQAEAASQKQGSLVSCYVPSIDQVILPAAKYWPSADELTQMRAHEWAHARGWRHNDNGTGTSPASLAPIGNALRVVSDAPAPALPNALRP